MYGAKGDAGENAGGEQGRIDNKTEDSKADIANGLSGLNGHHDRGEDTEKDTDGIEKREGDRARGLDRSIV